MGQIGGGWRSFLARIMLVEGTVVMFCFSLQVPGPYPDLSSALYCVVKGYPPIPPQKENNKNLVCSILPSRVIGMTSVSCSKAKSFFCISKEGYT